MSAPIDLACQCGAFAAELRDVRPEAVNRGTCYCHSCQAYAHHLGAATTALDAHGGTRIAQMRPARLVVSRGAEHLAALKLSTSGILRWYASCCNTPLANTPPNPRFAFVGVLESNLQGAAQAHDQALGKPAFHVWTQHAHGAAPPATGGLGMLAMGLRFGRVVLGALLRGEHRDNAFFSAAGTPRVTPYVLSASEHAAAFQAADSGQPIPSAGDSA